NWRIYLARGGVYFPMLFSHNATEVQCSKEIHVTDVQLGKPEAFGGKQATVLHYQVQGKGKDFAFKVSVWLDLVTKLPLKSEIKFAEKEDLLRIVEIYSDWALDEKLDAKQFTLPEK